MTIRHATQVTKSRACRAHRKKRVRRGAGIAVVVLLLAILNLAILGAVGASGDDLSLAALRVETTRAFYAAEGGGIIASRLVREGLSVPVVGSSLMLSNARITYVTVPATATPGTITIEGTSGDASRRISIVLSVP